MKSPLKSKTIKAVVIVTENAILEEKNKKKKKKNTKTSCTLSVSI